MPVSPSFSLLGTSFCTGFSLVCDLLEFLAHEFLAVPDSNFAILFWFTLMPTWKSNGILLLRLAHGFYSGDDTPTLPRCPEHNCLV